MPQHPCRGQKTVLRSQCSLFYYVDSENQTEVLWQQEHLSTESSHWLSAASRSCSPSIQSSLRSVPVLFFISQQNTPHSFLLLAMLKFLRLLCSHSFFLCCGGFISVPLFYFLILHINLSFPFLLSSHSLPPPPIYLPPSTPFSLLQPTEPNLYFPYTHSWMHKATHQSVVGLLVPTCLKKTASPSTSGHQQLPSQG